MPIPAVRVTAYLLPPHVGPATPAQAVAVLHGGPAVVPPGSGATAETDPHVLTCRTAGPNGPRDWSTSTRQLPGTAGQLCLAAVCYTAMDGAPPPADGPFTADDPRHGQRNLLLLTAPVFRGTLLAFQVLPGPRARTSVLELVPLLPGALDTGERWLLGSHPAVTVVGSGAGQRWRAVRDSAGRLCPIQTAQRPLGAQLAVTGARPAATVALPALTEPRAAELRVPVPGTDRPGTLHAVDIVQRDRTGELLGGLRVLALVTT